MFFKRIRSLLLASAFVLALGIAWAVFSVQSEGGASNRGELVAQECHDCHSPKIFTPRGPQPDPGRPFSGHPADAKLPEIPRDVISPDNWGGLFSNDLTAWVGPWGVSFGTNLTPDKETGIGNWSFDIFKDVMRSGMYHDGSRPFLPPMPTFSAMSDEDLKAMYEYFMSLEPIANRVPDPIPPHEIGLMPPPAEKH